MASKTTQPQKMSTTQVVLGQQQEQFVPIKRTSAKPSGAFCISKMMVAIGSLLLLAVVCTVAVVCVAVFSPKAGAGQSGESDVTKTIQGLEKREALLNQLVESHKSERASIQRRSGTQRSMERPCYSLKTNDSYPAAHITGISGRWADENIPSPSNPSQFQPGASDEYGYKSHWVCMQTRGAFVDGGMYFNQTDKKLYVPTCGYYYVSSQMYFDYTPTEGDKYVSHLLTVERNCGESVNLELESLSSLGAMDMKARTSTYLADIVKICKGGKISVKVPANLLSRDSPCCPGGADPVTFISAHLVSETECEWNQDRILPSPPTQQDYDNYYNKHSN